MSILNSPLFQYGMNIIAQQEEANNRMEERIMKDWEDSKSMPRKMKKQRRKDILLDYSILQYSRSLINNF